MTITPEFPTSGAVLPDGAAGAPVEPEFIDYFSFSDIRTFDLPGPGGQWIQFKIMSEGDKARFQRSTNRDIKVNQKTQDATIRADVAGERHQLIKASVVNWRMLWKNPATGGVEEVPFSESGSGHPSKLSLDVFLARANPKIVEDLEYAIRMANPWMQGDMTIEEIDKEIERLRELREQREREDAGNS